MSPREQLQRACELAFQPACLNAAWTQWEQGNVADPHALRQLVDWALTLHQRLPEAPAVTNRALRRLAGYQVASRLYRLPTMLRRFRQRPGTPTTPIIQNPKSKIQNPKSKIQNPKSKIQNPKSKIQNHKPPPPMSSLALIGAGYWGKNLARNFHALGALRLLCDRDADILGSYGDDYAEVTKTANYDDALADPAITQIAIAVPAALHYRLARAALEAGKDVFIEKPLCLDIAEGRELVEFAAQRQRILMVGHLLQYHPCVRKIQELVEAGELGKLHYITSNRLNLGKIRREENALWSFAPHDLSVILSLVGHQLPQQVRCLGEDYLSDHVADTTLTTLRFADRVRAHIYVSWLNPFKEQKLTVVGSLGMAVFDDTRPWPEKLVVHRNYLTWAHGQVPTPNRQIKGEPVAVPETEPLREECAHFLDCCRSRSEPRTDGAEGLRVLQVLQMAQRSLESDGEAIQPDPASPAAAAPTAAAQPAAATDYFAHPTAVIDPGAVIGAGTRIWHFSHVMKGACIGERCVLGQNVNVDGGTRLGNNIKVQNNVSIYTGIEIEDDVFLGPSCVLTNVTNPRSQINRHDLYEKTLIRRGATVGANATVVCGVTLGRYCFIAAGAVVTRDVPDYALMVGNPARQKGWMSRHGHLLKDPDANDIMICPESGYRYQVHTARDAAGTPTCTLRCLDLDEDASLPPELAKGTRSYDQFKTGTK